MSPQRLKIIVKILKIIVPEMDSWIEEMEKGGGWLKIPAEYIDRLIELRINWWQYYENEKLLQAIGATMLLNREEAIEFHKQGKLDILWMNYAEFLQSPESIEQPTEAELEKWIEQFQEATDEERVVFVKPVCKVVLGTILCVFNYLSMMVHKQTLCQLVSAAKKGNDEALFKAVQIDRAVLRLDYFQDRFLKAQFSGDKKFLDKLTGHIKRPPLKSKIRYRTLFLTFAILENEGLLDQPHEQLLDICEEIGVYGKKFGVEDVGHLTKRLREYRKMQKTSKIF